MSQTWFDRATHDGRIVDPGLVLAAKVSRGATVSVVLPARDEAATVGAIVRRVVAAYGAGLVDEVVVIDSDSQDDTARLAREAGAEVHALRSIRPDLGHHPGKGEALWKSQFVTRGDLVVFLDADLTDWDEQVVPALVAPLLDDDRVHLVKAFYERPFREGGIEIRHGGGRATELVARPVLALAQPSLSRVVQPLAGEWAIRRDTWATLAVPTGYGVDVAALIDVATRHGIDAVAQVGLGVRAHSHQSVQALAAMSVQVLAAVASRSAWPLAATDIDLHQFTVGADQLHEQVRSVDLSERPPRQEVTDR